MSKLVSEVLLCRAWLMAVDPSTPIELSDMCKLVSSVLLCRALLTAVTPSAPSN